MFFQFSAFAIDTVIEIDRVIVTEMASLIKDDWTYLRNEPAPQFVSLMRNLVRNASQKRLAVAVKCRDLTEITKGLFKLIPQVRNEGQHHAALSITGTGLKKLLKEGRFSRSGAGDNQLSPTIRLEDTLDGLFELLFSLAGATDFRRFHFRSLAPTTWPGPSINALFVSRSLPAAEFPRSQSLSRLAEGK